jgi:CRISPR type III-associated protein (TIGR04423 family)
MTKEEIVKYINDELKGYEGYVQFSHRPIKKTKDVFVDKNPKVENEQGFIYEAHFCNAKKSISIKQINESWLVSETDISNTDNSDMQSYISDISGFNYKIKMAQIWEERQDELCKNMRVKKLKKVVFAGFEKGDMR